MPNVSISKGLGCFSFGETMTCNTNLQLATCRLHPPSWQGLSVSDPLFPDIYDFVEEDDVTLYAKELSSWSGTLTDIDHNNIIRCHAYVMKTGTCLRTNSVPLYMEANRQVLCSTIILLSSF